MKFHLNLITIFLSLLLLTNCASKISVKTEPSDVNLYIRNPGSSDKILLGKSPYESTVDEIESKIKVSGQTSQYFEMIAEKEGLNNEVLLVPLSRIGHLKSEIFIKMESGVESAKLLSTLLQYIFNAQKFANSRLFERALEEVDKALAIEPNFANALTMKGSIYFLAGNFSDSLKNYEMAIKIDPKNEDALRMIASLREKVGLPQ